MTRHKFKKLIGQAAALVPLHLNWLDRMTRCFPRRVLAVLATLLTLSLVSLATLRFETDIFQLFPADRPALRLLLDSLEWSGGAREAYFLLEGEPQQLPGEAERLAERLRALQVDGAPAFKRVVYRIYEEAEAQRFADLVAFAAAHPAAFVPPDQLDTLMARFSNTGIEQALDQLTTQLATSLGASSVGIAVADPLGLRDLILPRLKAGSQALDMDPSSAYFMSRDGRVLIMIAEPAKPVQEMAFARKLVAGINQARAGSQVAVSCAGAHISAVIDEAAMKSNILACIVSSLLIVLGIFYAVYRHLWPTLMIPVFVASGVLAALGLAGLFRDSVHIISFAFTALVIGLGADYSIHIYDRFHTERSLGASTDEAVTRAITDTGQAQFVAAASTCLPFLVLAWAEVRALSELGLLVGLGVLFTLYANLVLMPLVLRRLDASGRNYRPLPTVGMDRLWRFIGCCPRTILAITAVSWLMLLLFAQRSSFDVELKNLQPQHSEAFRAQQLVEQHLNLAPKSLLVAVDGDSQAAVLRDSLPVEQLAAKLAGQNRLQAWSSLGQAMNRQAEQRQITDRLSQITRPVAVIEQQLERRGFNQQEFTAYLALLRVGSLTAVVPEDAIITQLKVSPLRSVVERHLVQDATGWHALTYLYFNPGQLHPEQFVNQLASVAPEARVTGTDLVSSELLEAVRRSAVQGIGLGTGLVLLLLLLHFRNVTGVAASLSPVLFGAVAMLGMMAVVGLKFNFMNIMVVVTIVGIGCNYGMHVFQRCSTHNQAQQSAAFVQAGRSILLSALTTIAGFGSLAFTDYGAMASIGWAANYGIFFTALAALLPLPALMHRVYARR